MDYKNISLIFPVRNEKDNIECLIKKALRILGERGEIIVVDDGSTDGTDKVIRQICLKNVSLIKNKNKGLASAIDSGIKVANCEIVCWMDADLSMPIELIPVMITGLASYDIVLGSRYIEGGKDLRKSRLRIISSWLFNLLSKKILNTQVNDLTSGFVATKKDIVQKIGLKGKQGEYCIWFLFNAERLGFKIKELPYSMVERKYGRSKIGSNLFTLLKNSFFYFKMVLELKFRDLFVYRDNNL